MNDRLQTFGGLSKTDHFLRMDALKNPPFGSSFVVASVDGSGQMSEEPIDRYGRSVYQVGTRQMIDLVPYVFEDTEFIPAGPISIGVAACDIYRSPGVTFHVIGTEDRLERLRFDCPGR
jgi:hypothetical protein